MLLKAKNVLYKVDETLNIKISNIIADLTNINNEKFITLDDLKSYKLEIHYASIALSMDQFLKTINDMLSALFKHHFSDLNIGFLPDKNLETSFIFKKIFPVKFKGAVNIDHETGNIIYNLDFISVYNFKVSTILDALAKLPGFSLNYQGEDKRFKIKNNLIIVYPQNFLAKFNAHFSITDFCFNENEVILEIKKDSIPEESINTDQNLPNSHVLLTGDRIKINNIEISDLKACIYRENESEFTFALDEYKQLLFKSTVKYTDEQTIKVIIQE